MSVNSVLIAWLTQCCYVITHTNVYGHKRSIGLKPTSFWVINSMAQMFNHYFNNGRSRDDKWAQLNVSVSVCVCIYTLYT